MILNDDRKYRRFSASQVKVNLRLSFPHDASFIDMSLGGMKIQTSKNLRIGQLCTFQIEAQPKPVMVKARTVWCALRQSKALPGGQQIPIYWAGLSICKDGSSSLHDDAPILTRQMAGFP